MAVSTIRIVATPPVTKEVFVTVKVVPEMEALIFGFGEGLMLRTEYVPVPPDMTDDWVLLTGAVAVNVRLDGSADIGVTTGGVAP